MGYHYMETKEEKMIEISDVSKSYGKIEALKNVSFSVKSGEIVALLGQNGAGKSTLLKILVGYLLPDSGEITIFGKKYADSREQILSHIGYVPENSLLYPEMSVYDFLKLSADLKQLTKEDFIENAKELIEKLDLKQVITQKNSTLSKGYRKRVEIAAALLNKPDILILDEPTEGLDPNQKEIVRNFLKEYSKRNTVIISTHILEEVKIMANRIIMLSNGIKSADLSKAQFNTLSLEDLFK